MRDALHHRAGAGVRAGGLRGAALGDAAALAAPRSTLPLVIAGIGLSTLHQSSLGTLFLLTPDRMHPLWYTPILPLLFFVSAVGLGLAMVATESLATSWLYRRETEWHLLRGLTRAAAVVLGLYLVIRLGDLAWRGQLRYCVEGSWASTLFVVELLMSTVHPDPALHAALRAQAAGACWPPARCWRRRVHPQPGRRRAASPTSRSPAQSYLPALTEIFVSVGVVSGLALIFLFVLERFPVWEEQPRLPEHFTPPLRDPITRTYFGRPWFGRTQLAAAGLDRAACVLGIFLLETTTSGWTAPRAAAGRGRRARSRREKRAARQRSRQSVPPGHGTPAGRSAGTAEKRAPVRSRCCSSTATAPGPSCCSSTRRTSSGWAERPRAASATTPTFRWIGARPASPATGTCTAPPTPTVTTGTSRVLGGNRSCARCHEDRDRRPRPRAESKPCADCHKAEIAQRDPGAGRERAAARRGARLPRGDARAVRSLPPRP